MKGGSQKAKGHKSTGGKRTWYGKQETQKCCVTAMRSISRAQARLKIQRNSGRKIGLVFKTKAFCRS